jgi:alpha/beta superfamily hydrolase
MFGKIVKKEGENIDYTLHPGNDQGREVVVIGHGVTGNKDRPFLVELATAIAKTGIHVLRFSFTGNGKSGGHFSDSTITKEIEDLESVLKAIPEYTITYVGHSMGGAVGVLCASRNLRISKLISLAGMVHTEAFAEREFGNEVPGKGFMWGEEDCPLSKIYMDDMSNIKTVVNTVSDIKVPWLLVHGSEDDVVPLSDSEDIKQMSGSNADLRVIDGADHVFSNHTSEMADIVVDWLLSRKL